MLHADIKPGGAALDWTVAQALGDQPVDGELHRLRAAQEATLRAARSAFEEKKAEAEALRAELNGQPEPFTDPAIDTETLLAVAATLLPTQVKAWLHAERVLEAFRARHGLTRAPVAPQTTQNLLFLAILVFVDGGINAGFFLNAHMAASPMAALLLSLLIALTNVTVSACAGYFAGRWKDYGLNAADADSPAF